MIDGLRRRNREVLRKSLIDVNTSKIEVANSIIDDAVAYFERVNDHESVRDALKARFAVGIKKQQTIDGDPDSGYETYRKGAVGEQIDQGLIETVTAGVGGKIASALANLFTAENQNWSYTGEDGQPSQQSEDAEELIWEHRKHGGFTTSMVNADFLASSINGSFVYVDTRGDYLKYHVISPTCFYSIFHETIMDSGVERAVDYSEIEDATAIVIKLSDSLDANPTQNQFLAIFGRSDVYPFGRHVTYRSSRWDSIPDVGDPEAHDYTLPSGEIANPLSYLAATHLDEAVHEYPVIKIDGGLTKVTNEIVTTSTSLFENCIEFDIGYSRLLKDGLTSARGKDIIKNPLGRPLPRSLEGAVALQDGQELTVDGQPASNAQGAMDVLESCVISVASGYNVPGYMVVSGPDMLNDSSGVALLLRMTPMISFRDYRIELNSPQINRLWVIERNLLRVFWGDQYEYLATIEQAWDAGTLVVPEDNKAKTERLEMAVKAKFIDQVEAVKRWHNLATDEEAQQLIEKYNERETEFPSPGQQQQNQQPTRQVRPVGLTFGQ
jgi:hypothetical protein